MTLSTQTGASPNTPTLTAGKAVRLAIERNFRLLLLAAVVIGLGLVFNWSWLVAAGIAPVLLSVLPCLAMCALGLCMVGMRGRSCEAQPSAPDAASGQAPELTGAPPKSAPDI